MKLFSDTFPLVKTQSELEKVLKKFSEYGTDYVSSACLKERRDWIESLWVLYEEYAETNFRSEFETISIFNKKAWELYLGHFLLKNKFILLGKTGKGPDFHIKINGKDIFIEATAPTVGEVDPAPARPDIKAGETYMGGGDIEETYRTKILRLVTAIRNKSDKIFSSQYYKGKTDGSIKDSDCYIVAINGHDFCGLVSDPSFLLRRSLFAAGCMTFRLKKDGTLGKGEYLYKPFVIKIKPGWSKENIPTDIFANDSYSEISAIIYSPEHIINTVHDIDSLGDTLTLIKNPFAKNPLPEDFPVLGMEVIFENNAITYKDNRKPVQ